MLVSDACLASIQVDPNRAESNLADRSRRHSSTAGLLFLGDPHWGEKKASCAAKAPRNFGAIPNDRSHVIEMIQL
jgi:hypothetical protein